MKNEVGLTPRTKKLWEWRQTYGQDRDKYPHWTEFKDNRLPDTKCMVERIEHFKEWKLARETRE